MKSSASLFHQSVAVLVLVGLALSQACPTCRSDAEQALRQEVASSFWQLEKTSSQSGAQPKSLDSRQTAGSDSGISASDIAIVTMVGETNVKAYSDYSVYRDLSKLTLQSMTEYATQWGHPLFFLHEKVMDQGQQPYWAKIVLMQHYLSLGYKYVLYTDIDVLFLKMDVPLSTFIIPGKDIISADECANRNETLPLIRSGFLILRNSPTTFAFLRHWKDSHRYFEHIENPEQSALELLVSLPEFAPRVHLHSWKSFHAYDLCDGYHSAFSVHFPGPHKVVRVGRALTWFKLHESLVGTSPEQQSLTTLLGGLPSVEELASDLTKAELRLPIPSVGITEQARARVESCLAASRALGYQVPAYSEERHRHVLEYDISGFYFNIPTVIYFTVPDASRVPESIRHNINSWASMNPDFQVVIYDDQGIEKLVTRFLDMDAAVWQSLLPVQKTDIWRYLVVYLFGGWYFDSDVECVRPIRLWGQHPSDTLVVGVELNNLQGPPVEGYAGQRGVVFSQYAFGSAARHPAIGAVLASILRSASSLGQVQHVSSQERLQGVLATTGPWAWTDALADIFCYSDSYPPNSELPLSTPHVFGDGGHLVNTHVFGIAGFGAGQYHSGSPVSRDAAEVNAWHHFGGSTAFHGKRWTELS